MVTVLKKNNMAFKINRSIIKGTQLHKQSIARAKAKKSIVSQARVKPDTSLVTAAELWGKSLNPGEIDYKFTPAIVDPGDLTPEEREVKKKKGDDVTGAGKGERVDVKPIEQETEMLEVPSKIDPPKTKTKKKEKVAKVTVEKPIVGGIGEKAIRNYNKEEQKRLQTEGVFNEQVGRVVLPEEHDANTGNYIPSEKEYQVIDLKRNKTEKPKPSDFRDKKNPFGGTLTRIQQYKEALRDYYKNNPVQMRSQSAVKKRDDRIYRNARSGGAVQRNMIKNGYNPQK